MAGLPSEKDETAYDAAAFIAFFATSSMAWGKIGFILVFGALILSIGGEAIGVGDRWHVLGKSAKERRDSRDLKNKERFPNMQPTLEVERHWN